VVATFEPPVPAGRRPAVPPEPGPPRAAAAPRPAPVGAAGRHPPRPCHAERHLTTGIAPRRPYAPRAPTPSPRGC